MNVMWPAATVRLVEDIRAKQIAWVDRILQARGWNLTELAGKAGLSASTLTRWRNSESAAREGRTLNSRSVEGIARAANVRAYEDASGDGRGLAESEGEPYRPEPGEAHDAAVVDAIRAGRNGIDAWRLSASALDLAGYLPGDIVFVDLNAEPRNSDVVCAQVYDWKRGRAETVFRIFDQPYLLAASTDPALRRPLTVDGQTVVIKGVIINALRPRRAA